MDIFRLLVGDNGDVDLEKLLCLHLLALRPAKSCYKKSHYTHLTRYANILPNYLIYDKAINNCNCFYEENETIRNKKNLTVHVSISEKMENLIYTTLKAIKHVNKEKLEQLKLMAFNINIINKLLYDGKFYNLKNFCKYNARTIINEGIITERGELTKLTFINLHKDRDYSENTVFLLEKPKCFSLYRNIYWNENDNYYASIFSICTQIKTSNFMLPYQPGLCILKNPSKPTALAVLSDDANFISMITGPQFYKFNRNSFENIGLYVKLRSYSGTYQEEWNEATSITLKSVSKKTKKIIKENNKTLVKKMLEILSDDSKITLDRETSDLIEQTDLKEPEMYKTTLQILRRNLSTNSLLHILVKCSLNERETALKSKSAGGLGFTKVLIGKRNKQLMKDLCRKQSNDVVITPINSDVNKIVPSQSTLKVPDDLDTVYDEVYEYEFLKSTIGYLKNIDTDLKAVTKLPTNPYYNFV
ncbi:uncharacterized protein isoform X2 [Rhodnius prolixus]|uniref:uncharacterized protein isoform X2 n=1 Tax=Rhodnius prolixus TaxID=13249 RepID=UPI003D18EEC2